MSNHHIIAIGGTGQHVAFSVLNIALITGDLPPTIWLNDSDQGEAFDKIIDLRHSFDDNGDNVKIIYPYPRIGENDLENFRDHITGLWKESQTGTTVGNLSDIENVLSVLFSNDALNVQFKKAMYGLPPVGATIQHMKLILANNPEIINDPPFEELASRLKSAAEDSRVVFTGSHIGGTGSGGQPAFAEYSRNSDGKACCVTFDKHFELDFAGSAAPNIIDNDDLLRNAQSTIAYFRRYLLDHIDRVYTLGLANNYPQRVSDGPDHQKHHSHFVHLIGALLALNWLRNSENIQPINNRDEKLIGVKYDLARGVTLPIYRSVLLDNVDFIKSVKQANTLIHVLDEIIPFLRSLPKVRWYSSTRPDYLIPRWILGYRERFAALPQTPTDQDAFGISLADEIEIRRGRLKNAVEWFESLEDETLFNNLKNSSSPTGEGWYTKIMNRSHQLLWDAPLPSPNDEIVTKTPKELAGLIEKSIRAEIVGKSGDKS